MIVKCNIADVTEIVTKDRQLVIVHNVLGYECISNSLSLTEWRLFNI